VSYIESNLLPDETVVHRASLHWLIFWKAMLAFVAGLALFLVDPIAGAVGVAVALVLAIPPLVARTTSEFGVTSKRVIVKAGLIQRRTLELLLRQVESIQVEQSIIGRMFNYGSITLSGTGGVREVFHNISAPLQFRRKIQSLTA
jgi:uncharacterized membrane protein YdbT with pleckstrin-like domain